MVRLTFLAIMAIRKCPRAPLLTLVIIFYAVVAGACFWTGMPRFIRPTEGEPTSRFVGELYSHDVCGTDIWESSESFVKAHGFKVIPTVRGCVSAQITIVHICLLWFLVFSAIIGWGIFLMISICASIRVEPQINDEESGRSSDSDCMSPGPCWAMGDALSQTDEAGTIQAQAHHGFFQLNTISICTDSTHADEESKCHEVLQ